MAKNAAEMALDPQHLRGAAEGFFKQAEWLRHTARAISFTAPTDPGPATFMAAAEHLERLANATLAFVEHSQSEEAREALKEIQRDPVAAAQIESIINPAKERS